MMSFRNSVPLVYDMKLLEMGFKEWVEWKPERHPMMLIVGGTGSGKTYHMTLLMGKISKHIPDSQLFLCDFKDLDFRMFRDSPRRWSYENCMDGLNAFYDSFKNRLDGSDITTNRKFLIFDEWAAFVLSREKKAAEDVKSKLSTLLMVGRGVQHHIIIGLQRADSALFPMGGRDQFGAIFGLGNLSREQRIMLFPDYREEMTDINGRGQGYLSLDGDIDGLKRVVVPSVSDFDKLHTTIREGLSR
jgi:hypothetical protein